MAHTAHTGDEPQCSVSDQLCFQLLSDPLRSWCDALLSPDLSATLPLICCTFLCTFLLIYFNSIAFSINSAVCHRHIVLHFFPIYPAAAAHPSLADTRFFIFSIFFFLTGLTSISVLYVPPSLIFSVGLYLSFSPYMPPPSPASVISVEQVLKTY